MLKDTIAAQCLQGWCNTQVKILIDSTKLTACSEESMSGAVVDTHQRYMRQSAVIVTQPPRHISACQVEPPEHEEEEEEEEEEAMVVVWYGGTIPYRFA